MSESVASVDVPEIEVTPEMIEAGVDCLHDIDLAWFGEADLERVLANAFKRMFSLLPERRVNGP